MNFKGHLIGGVVTGCILGSIGAMFFHLPAHQTIQILFTTLFFSLFPDLDTSSIPQRWFYRAVIITLLVLALQKQFQLATLLAVVSLTPLITKHRGWTHHILMPFIAPSIIALSYQHFFIKSLSFKYTSLTKVIDLLTTNIWLALACTIGWVTHLYLDKLIPDLNMKPKTK